MVENKILYLLYNVLQVVPQNTVWAVFCGLAITWVLHIFFDGGRMEICSKISGAFPLGIGRQNIYHLVEYSIAWDIAINT